MAGLATSAASAQEPRPATPRDTAQRAPVSNPQSPIPDSLDPDSLRPLVPPFGPPAGPVPRFQRLVFTRDDLDWLGARSLGELLAFIPGAFLVRSGWFGSPEAIGYAGQGAASLELYLDGYLLAPMGEDSAGHDLSRFDIGLYRRVEVEVLPAVLRVHLISDMGTVRRPRTEASFATGDAQTNTYRGRYLNRWANGAGLGIAASYFATDGPSTSPNDINTLLLWGRGTWTPSPRVGVEYTFTRTRHKREGFTPQGAIAPLPALDVTRSDAFVRATAATREEGRGLRFDALLGSSHYQDSSRTVSVDESQAAGAVAYRAPTWMIETAVRLRSGATPFSAQARGSWAAGRWLTLSAWAMTTRHLGDQRAAEAGAGAELRPVSWLAAYGALRTRDLRTDTTQRVSDWNLGIGLQTRRAGLDVSLQRHGAFRAPAYGAFAAQLPALTSIDVLTLTASWELRPASYLTLHGWYRHPLDPIAAAFEPPHHTRAAATFRSRFLPHYRRGIFDLLVQAELEGWSSGGVVGRNAQGAVLPLESATIVNYLLEIRLVGAILYWTLRNPQLERYAIVPGFEMPRGLQRFGVRWEFTN